MQINEAVGVFDKLISDGVQSADIALAWVCIRKELVEGQKPTTNSASAPCPNCHSVNTNKEQRVTENMCRKCSYRW